MLLQKAFDANQVITFKTVFGEEIISRVSEQTDTHYVLNKPMVLIQVQNGLGLAPAAYSIPAGSPHQLNKTAVALMGTTEHELANQFLEKTTGLTLATRL